MTIVTFLILSLSFIISYVIGAIPTGYWFAKYIFGVNITKTGSKSIGATNVARVLKDKKYFFIVFFLDFLKAVLCLSFLTFFLSYYFAPMPLANFLILNAIILLVGNSYSIFINFRGGKGVATTLGILIFFFSFKLFLIFLAFWGIILFYTKEIYIASLFAMYFITFLYYFFFYESHLPFLFLLFLSLWLTFRHMPNIKNFLIKNNKNKRKKK